MAKPNKNEVQDNANISPDNPTTGVLQVGQGTAPAGHRILQSGEILPINRPFPSNLGPERCKSTHEY